MTEVLLVDDSGAVRATCRKVLESEGYTVREAGDGIEALRNFLDRPADIVVCDIFMPNKDGIATIRELALIAPETPIIVISGGARNLNGFFDFARVLGARGALPKPFTPEQLLDEIDRVLGSGVVN